MKGATTKGKKRLPIGSIFFLLKAVHMRVDNNLKNINLETITIKLRQYVSLVKSPNFDAANINPYKPIVLSVGHLQTVQNQIRRRKLLRLIRFIIVCLRKCFFLKFE